MAEADETSTQYILQQFRDEKISLEECTRQIESINKKEQTQLMLKASQKGCMSLYKLRRLPVSLYKDEWVRVLDFMIGEGKWNWSPQVTTFLEENGSKLATKQPSS